MRGKDHDSKLRLVGSIDVPVYSWIARRYLTRVKLSIATNMADYTGDCRRLSSSPIPQNRNRRNWSTRGFGVSGGRFDFTVEIPCTFNGFLSKILQPTAISLISEINLRP